MTVEYNGMIDYCNNCRCKRVIVGVLLGAVTFFLRADYYSSAGKIIDMDIGISMAQLIRSYNKNAGWYHGKFLLLYDDASAYNFRYASDILLLQLLRHIKLFQLAG